LLRFTSVEEHPARSADQIREPVLMIERNGAPARFSTEVKHSEASHEGEKCAGAPAMPKQGVW
jgi:hypothetical protein